MEMKHDNTDETFLADWLAGNLADAELRAKVSGADFEAYLKLRSSLGALELQKPDIEANYAAVKAKKVAVLDKKHAPKVINLYRYVAVAAAVLLLFGLFNVYVFSKNSVTGFGQQASVVLDDDSVVTLNAKSDISYPNFFAVNRTLKLNGEAFFEVSRGNRFTVETAHGSVEVLGTKFNVIAHEDFLEVACHEGKVMVCSGNVSKVLFPGDAIRISGNRPETWKLKPNNHPLWTNRESAFTKMPLEWVILELENQYNITVHYPENLKSARFTGSFTHENLDFALQAVCIPMNLKYTKDNGKITISE